MDVKMTFIKAWRNFWTKRYNITDRATRPEFWLMFPFLFVAPYLFYWVALPALPLSQAYWALTFYLIFLVITFFPAMTLFVRRFNDIALPAWIPIIMFGASDGVDILLAFNFLIDNNMKTLIDVSSFTSLAGMFVLGTCIAPSVYGKK
jgi:uncharacterized membrane protein YhaH (DUF805 family)